jgi:hypothetical protein
MIRFASRQLMPPFTGVPVPGTSRGSMPSRSNDTWKPAVPSDA